jgi:hypothetical protein
MATKRARKTTKRGASAKKSVKKTAKKSGGRSTPNVALRMQLEAVMKAIDKAPAATQSFAEIEDLRAALPPAIQVLQRNPGAGQSEITGPRP